MRWLRKFLPILFQSLVHLLHLFFIVFLFLLEFLLQSFLFFLVEGFLVRWHFIIKNASENMDLIIEGFKASMELSIVLFHFSNIDGVSHILRQFPVLRGLPRVFASWGVNWWLFSFFLLLLFLRGDLKELNSNFLFLALRCIIVLHLNLLSTLVLFMEDLFQLVRYLFSNVIWVDE